MFRALINRRGSYSLCLKLTVVSPAAKVGFTDSYGLNSSRKQAISTSVWRECHIFKANILHTFVHKMTKAMRTTTGLPKRARTEASTSRPRANDLLKKARHQSHHQYQQHWLFPTRSSEHGMPVWGQSDFAKPHDGLACSYTIGVGRRNLRDTPIKRIEPVIF